MIESMDDQLADLKTAFKLYGVKTDDAIGKAIKTCCIIVEGQAALFAPVDTGLLRKSINHRVRKVKDTFIGEVGTNVEYAPFQEFGTSKMKPQPFLTPALTINRARIGKIIGNAIAKVEP
jgi:HK97 gp10 family phage protein